ncbi:MULTISPECIES: phosphoesterase [unclassified Micromonospora]|uniref:phosphoesterase n=1 Tax=unclassified Micromonospora TaxID=2617518 RepID=UPI000EF511F6|nr:MULTISPECIES: phosphoesterase [unclassified Micromonospora]RLP85665.1 phosphoesterase [Micromonospora sp. BL4]RLP97234.1 phosphoesterase [Micromonospora sp. CV4]
MRDKQPEEVERAQLSRRKLVKYAGVGATLAAASPLVGAGAAWADEERRPGDDRDDRGNSKARAWRAGDHHVHSEYSGEFDTTKSPVVFHKGADAVYPIVTNAIMAKNFGLSWAMCTDHGGPTHSKVNIEQAYPDLLRSRKLVPEVLQFWGMEFDAPSLDHHTLMIPRHDDEAKQLFELESRFAKYDAFPTDPARDTEAKMVEFLKVARGMPHKPLVIAHHASRSAPGLGVYGQDTPREFRNGNNAAPDVYIGFEGAPGHQAGPLNGGARGGYGNHPTYGGFDQMTARVGGLWDSLLGEGRRWWITATSDSHVHWTRGGSDFWPGEYSKTYVHARQDYGDIMDGLRNGRIWVTTGDLVRSLDVTASSQGRTAEVGETITVSRRSRTDVEIEIKFRPLDGENANGDRPEVRRVDLIVGQITGPSASPDADTNPTTKVVARFGPRDWRRQGADYVIRHTLRNVEADTYARVRGTSTDEAEPLADGLESPWDDLWFYSNPVFVHVR